MAADADILQLISQVKVEGNFDQPDGVILNWLSRRHMTMCARSKCYRGNASADDVPPSVLPFPVDRLNDIDPSTEQTGLVEFLSLAVNGVPWGKVDWETFEKAKAGMARLSGSGGIWTNGSAGDADDRPIEVIFLYPEPAENFALQLATVNLPAPLNLNDSSSDPTVQTQLKIPVQFYDGLVAGAIATGLARTEQRPDLAAPMEAEFAAACEECRMYIVRKYRGTGPVTIRVVGYDA